MHFYFTLNPSQLSSVAALSWLFLCSARRLQRWIFLQLTPYINTRSLSFWLQKSRIFSHCFIGAGERQAGNGESIRDDYRQGTMDGGLETG